MKSINTLLLTLAILTLATVSGCFGDKSSSSDGNISSLFTTSLLNKVAKPFSAPDTEIADLNGTRHKLSDYRGKPVIVNFWATWCPPCRAELPSMNRAWAKVKDEGIIMLAVNVGETEETISHFNVDYPIDFTILLDQAGMYAPEWKIGGMPTTFIVDSNGLVVYKVVGTREWDNDKILDAVRALKKD